MAPRMRCGDRVLGYSVIGGTVVKTTPDHRSLITDHLPAYFFFAPRLRPRPATVFFGPLRVRALVRVRWPRTGSPRRWRLPRQVPRSIRRLMFIETSRRRSPSPVLLA